MPAKLIEKEKQARVPAVERAAELKEDAAARSFLNAVDVVDSIRSMTDVQVYLYRRQGAGEWSYLGVWGGEEFDIERVRALYGGGRYKMQTRGLMESGKRGWIDGGGAAFEIEGDPLPASGKTVPALAAVAPVAADPGALSDVARMMIEMANKRADDLLRLLEAEKKAPVGGGISEVITAVKEVMAMGQAVDPKQNMADMRDAMTEGMKMGQDMRGGGRKTEWADVVKDALPAIGEVARAVSLSAQQGRQPPQPVPPRPRVAPPIPGQPAQVVGTIAPAAGTETAEVAVEEPRAPIDRATVPPWLLQVEAYLPLLVSMAAMGMDPAMTADQILAKIPEESLDGLEADCRVDGWKDRTLGVLPPQLAQAHVGWTSQVLDAIHDVMTRPPEPGTDSDAEEGA